LEGSNEEYEVSLKRAISDKRDCSFLWKASRAGVEGWCSLNTSRGRMACAIVENGFNHFADFGGLSICVASFAEYLYNFIFHSLTIAVLIQSSSNVKFQ
jgi:hypothetical protein